MSDDTESARYLALRLAHESLESATEILVRHMRTVRAAERERIAKLVDENADVYQPVTTCAPCTPVLQSRLAAKIRAMGDER